MSPERIYARRWWILAVLCLSLVIMGMDASILNVALPTLARDLHAGSSALQWIVDAYTLVFASMLLTAGSLGDRSGRRWALIGGMSIFGIGSVLAAFSGSTALLIASRGLMGVGGALAMPATLSILTNVFPPEERAKAIGIWAGVFGIGIVAGPTLGGWLLGRFWWGSVFLVNVPVIAIALTAGWFLVPDSRDPHAPRVDVLGTVASILGLTGVLYGIIEAPSRGFTNPAVAGTFAAGLAVLAVFVVWELRTEHPMLDVRFFANPRFSAASASITLMFFALMGVMFFISQYLQSVLGYSPLRAGVGFLPLAAGMMISSLNSVRIAAWLGTKITVAAGMVLAASGVGLLSTAGTRSSYALIATVLAMVGLGIGAAMSPATDSIMGSLPVEKAGIGSAMNDTTREVGGALGVAVLGSITSAAYRGQLGASAAFTHLPASAQGMARGGIGNALAIAGQLPRPAAAALTTASRSAFVHGVSTTSVAGAAIILLGALVALLWLPARAAGGVPELAAGAAVIADAPVGRRADGGFPVPALVAAGEV